MYSNWTLLFIVRPEAEKPWSEEQSDVVHLTASDFETFIVENPSVMVWSN